MDMQKQIDAARRRGQITAAECYELAAKSWMDAAASDALVRAARTITALEVERDARVDPKGIVGVAGRAAA